MKGQKLLSEALKISKELHKYPSSLSESEEKILYQKYFDLLKKSAYIGNAHAQYCYAQQFDTMSFLGINNPLFNPKKCMYWYARSCKGGYAEAYNNLASFYEEGIYVKQDLHKSYHLYKQAAKLGSDLGKSNLRIFERDIKSGKYTI